MGEREEIRRSAVGCGCVTSGVALVAATAYGLYSGGVAAYDFVFGKERVPLSMTYLGSEVMGSAKYLYFDTDGNLETAEEARSVGYKGLPIARNLKVGQKVLVKDWTKVLPEQQKTRE